MAVDNAVGAGRSIFAHSCSFSLKDERQRENKFQRFERQTDLCPWSDFNCTDFYEELIREKKKKQKQKYHQNYIFYNAFLTTSR